MNDRNGEKLRVWNDRAALARHIWQGVVGLIVISSMATAMYLILDFRVQAADERSKANEKAIEKLTENVNALTTGQRLLNQAVINDRENNAEFRRRTDGALDSIIKKLDKINERSLRGEAR